MPDSGNRPRIAVAAIMKDEGPYILEWIAHYESLGFDTAIICDNGSSDGGETLLRELEREGVCETFRFETDPDVAPQLLVYDRILNEYRTKFDWILFVDADEFLVSNDNKLCFLDYLKNIEHDVGAIAFNWACYGSGFSDDAIDGLVMERFTRRATKDFGANHHYKSMVRTIYCQRVAGNPHQFVVQPGKRTVLSDGSNLVDHEKRGGGLSQHVCWSHFRINHYVVKSTREFLTKKARRGSACVVDRKKSWSYFVNHDKNDIEDPVNIEHIAIVNARILSICSMNESIKNTSHILNQKMLTEAREIDVDKSKSELGRLSPKKSKKDLPRDREGEIDKNNKRDVFIFVVGYNKCGTTSIHHMISKSGIRSIHWAYKDNGQPVTIASKMLNNMNAGRKTLHEIGDWRCFSDMTLLDRKVAIDPSFFYDRLRNEYPNSYFILNVRDVEKWIESRCKHPGFLDRARQAYGLRSDSDVLDEWRRQYSLFFSRFQKDANNSEKLLVFDIENDDPEAIKSFLKADFDVDTQFWGVRHQSADRIRAS